MGHEFCQGYVKNRLELVSVVDVACSAGIVVVLGTVSGILLVVGAVV